MSCCWPYMFRRSLHLQQYDTSHISKTALERGLIESDQSLSQCVAEASLFQFPVALRRLFATILVFCDPGDVRKLWDDHYHDMSEDYMRQNENVERVQNMVLTDINLYLESMGKSIDDFDLPAINRDVDLQSGGFREVQEESSIVVEDEHLHAQDFLNTEQKYAYDEIMRHVRTNCPGVFFIDGPGGTGKTYLYKALLANVRKCGHIALATASSGVAANNMPVGQTIPNDDMFPFKLRRKQFPVRLCFAMTINKAQGQTIPNVGVYLPEPVFSHGQLYVALSRGISRRNTKVLVKSVEKSNVDEVYTSNVVYKEVLSD